MDFPEWQMLVVGCGDMEHELHRRARQSASPDRILLVGNQEDVPLWLNCMDVFCLPSYGDEGVPQALMQAMACGVPAVSTPIGAISEALQDGVTGLMTPPRDSAQLTVTLDRLMRDPGLRKRFSDSATAYAQQNFGLKDMLDSMERVFRSVVASSV